MRTEDAKTGIGPAQLSALSVLVFGGEKILTELAAIEQVRPPTMSRIVDGLVSQGLARRVTDPNDRRSVRLSCTAKGKKLLQAGRMRRVRVLAERLNKLTPEEVDILGRAAQLMARL